MVLDGEFFEAVLVDFAAGFAQSRGRRGKRGGWWHRRLTCVDKIVFVVVYVAVHGGSHATFLFLGEGQDLCVGDGLAGCWDYVEGVGAGVTIPGRGAEGGLGDVREVGAISRTNSGWSGSLGQG